MKKSELLKRIEALESIISKSAFTLTNPDNENETVVISIRDNQFITERTLITENLSTSLITSQNL